MFESNKVNDFCLRMSEIHSQSTAQSRSKVQAEWTPDNIVTGSYFGHHFRRWSYVMCLHKDPGDNISTILRGGDTANNGLDVTLQAAVLLHPGEHRDGQRGDGSGNVRIHRSSGN